VCGARTSVEAPLAHAPRALRCTNCGGALKDGARACEYCSAEIKLDELRLDSVCPDCGARMSSGARYCMECGLAIEPQAWRALAADARCPRCASALCQRTAGALVLVECQTCAGLWLEPEQLDQLCERAEQDGAVLAALGLRGEPTHKLDSGAVKYLPCIRCAQPMNRRNFGGSSGIVVDVCKSHGVWLDHGELERAVAFARGGGLLRQRARELDRLRAEEARASQHAWTMEAPARRHETGELDLGLDLAALGGWLARAAEAVLRRRAG
jgi:Zn-finger nucleic acid-binding protein